MGTPAAVSGQFGFAGSGIVVVVASNANTFSLAARPCSSVLCSRVRFFSGRAHREDREDDRQKVSRSRTLALMNNQIEQH